MSTKHIHFDEEYRYNNNTATMPIDHALIASILRESTDKYTTLNYTHRYIFGDNAFYQDSLLDKLPEIQKFLDSQLIKSDIEKIQFACLTETGWQLITLWKKNEKLSKIISYH